TALDGVAYDGGASDVVARAISMGNCHRAFPLTSSMCLAVAARIEGSLVHEVSTAKPGADVRLGHPSGILPLDAAVTRPGGDYHAERVTVDRTARRPMEGWGRIPGRSSRPSTRCCGRASAPSWRRKSRRMSPSGRTRGVSPGNSGGGWARWGSSASRFPRSIAGAGGGFPRAGGGGGGEDGGGGGGG